MERSSGGQGGVGVGFLLFTVFLVLKLTGTIGWSWWWVTAPLWAPLAMGTLIVLAAKAIALAANARDAR